MGPKKDTISGGNICSSTYHEDYNDQKEHRAARRARRVLGVRLGQSYTDYH
jgi:hypothetical protein